MSENKIKDLSNSIKEAYRLIGENKLFDAIKLGNDLVKRFSGDPRSWNLLCEINRERGALTNAVRCAEQATRLAPDIPNYQIQYGRCLVMAGRRAEAKYFQAQQRVKVVAWLQCASLMAVGLLESS